MNVRAVRVDSRLVHGQVVESWLPSLAVQEVVVLDDLIVTDPLAQAAMRLALPTGVTLRVFSMAGFDLDALTRSEVPTLILVRTVAAAAQLDGLLGLAQHHVPLNLGVVQHTPERRTITPAVHLSEAEVETLAELDRHGVEVEVRGLPSQPAIGFEELRSLFAGAS